MKKPRYAITRHIFFTNNSPSFGANTFGYDPMALSFEYPRNPSEGYLDIFTIGDYQENQRVELLEFLALAITEFQERQKRLDEIAALKEEIEALKKELAVTDGLLAEYTKVLRTIPACPAHGDLCVPHALRWIAEKIATPENGIP